MARSVLRLPIPNAGDKGESGSYGAFERAE